MGVQPWAEGSVWHSAPKSHRGVQSASVKGHCIRVTLLSNNVNLVLVWTFLLTLHKQPSGFSVYQWYWCVLLFRFQCCKNGSECNCMIMTKDVFYGIFVDLNPFRTSATFIWMKHSCVAEAAEAAPFIPACVIINVMVKFKAPFQMSTPCSHFVSVTAIPVLTSLKLFLLCALWQI